MSVKQLNHIGIAVQSIEAQRAYYEDILGLTLESIEEVPSQRVRVAFYRVGEIRIELLEPTDPDSPIAKHIEKRGVGLHHVAFSVDGLVQQIADFEQSGIQMIDREPRDGSHHLKIAFVHPKSTFGVLTELCESSDH